MDELEVEIGTTTNKAIIEGKTAVPFKTFVSLILQRKVQVLFKRNSDDPIIVGSELLTALASAPQDRQEDRAKLVLVTLGVGIIAGIFFSAVVLIILMLLRVMPSLQDLIIVVGVIAGISILASLLGRAQKKPALSEKIYEGMEKVSNFIGR